jgi:UDP-N-acetylglucosamine:LPS N-acetylglucosamine transferase
VGSVPPRVLILTASVGEGHDLPARTLAAQLREERPDVEVAVEDCLAVMGRTVALVSEGAPRRVFYRRQWLWDVGFWLFVSLAPTRSLTQRLLTRFGSPGLLGLIGERDPDVIVSVYPNVTEVLGRLRRSGRLRVPVVAAITDLAAMHYWASRGVDVHLVSHRESIEEVRSIVGEAAPVHCVHGLTATAFRVPRDQEAARRRLDLPATSRVVLVSGGGWGVGDLSGAVEEALAVPAVSCVACLGGRNEALLAQLRSRFAGDQRVRVIGFTDSMADWLAAVDVLVHATGGLTMLEANMSGCPAISYGWGRGHLRVNNDAYRRFALAQVADTRVELHAAILDALQRGRTTPNGLDGLPSAASIVLAAAD